MSKDKENSGLKAIHPASTALVTSHRRFQSQTSNIQVM